MGKLQDKVVADPPIYSGLLLELLGDDDPKIALWAGFVCLNANIHTDMAMDRLVSIVQNIREISMICDFDIRGQIGNFRKRQMEAKQRNEVDALAEKMKGVDQEEPYTDAKLLDMVLELPDIDMCGHDGRTLLIHACIFDRFELAKALVERGADVNKKDFYQKTPLHCAVITGNIEIITLLLQHRVWVNAQDGRGFTALDFAKGNFAQLPQDRVDRVIDLLVSYGAKTKNEVK